MFTSYDPASSASSSSKLPKPGAALARSAVYTPAGIVSASPAYLMSGALATGSAYRFLSQPSLRSTGFLAVGLGGASVYFLSAKGTSFGLEDGPKLGVLASALAVSATLPSAARTLHPGPVLLTIGATLAGAYYAFEAFADEV